MSDSHEQEILKTPLYDLHTETGGKIVEFAGYLMPVQYSEGIVTEHTHTRTKAGLFDVSHMGQVWLEGESHDQVANALETLVPGDIAGLQPGQVRYTQFTNSEGGILDDLMVTRPVGDKEDGSLYLVINASRKHEDCEWMRAHLPDAVKLVPIEDRALLALQGPAAEAVLSKFSDDIKDLEFMSSRSIAIDGEEYWVSRSGYTGEDGFEISIPSAKAEVLARALLANPDVIACGLGARDTLRLEGGLCLYGNDLDESTSPVEAGLLWSIAKRRRENGGYPGSDRISNEIQNGPLRKRVGIKPDGRAPARGGTDIAGPDGKIIGKVTSGGFGPSVGHPIAMGYVPPEFSQTGTKLDLIIRGKALPATVVKLPFVPNNFKR